MVKIGRNAPCPCGSGRKHKLCCMGKVFTWHAESDELFTQSFPIEGGLKDSIDDLRATFVRHFGREPEGKDPLILSKYLLSPEDIKRLTAEAMVKAGIDEDKIYAYKKSGYLITDSSLDRATGAAIDEWDNAIDEFHEAGGDPRDPPEAKRFDSLLLSLVEELESLIYLYGIATDKFLNTELLPASTDSNTAMSPAQYQALCITRTHRSLRSIRVLLNERMSDDAFMLARSIYENYLHLIYVSRYPDKVADLVDAPLGIRAGTHAFKRKKDGSEDKRIIIEMQTGREYAGHISAYKMAESSHIPEDVRFFDFFYRRSSEFLHPSVFSLDSYLSEHGLSAVKSYMYEEGVVFSACISAMVADQIPFIGGCPNHLAKDCLVIVSRVKSTLLELLELLSVWQQRFGAELEDISILRQRCLRLAGS
jgi:hypothetical protein